MAPIMRIGYQSRTLELAASSDQCEGGEQTSNC